MRTHPEVIGTLGVLYKRSCHELYLRRRRRRKKLDGTSNGHEYFCSLKARSLMTWKQRRTVLIFDIG